VTNCLIFKRGADISVHIHIESGSLAGPYEVNWRMDRRCDHLGVYDELRELHLLPYCGHVEAEKELPYCPQVR